MADLYPARAHALKVLNDLLLLLPEADRTKPQLLFLQSKPVTYRDDTDRELPFRQESNFYHLSGCLLPNSSLLISYLPEPASSGSEANGAEVKEANVLSTLFVPEEDPLEVLWSPAPPSLEEAEKAHDASCVKPTSVLPHLLADLLGATPEALLHTLPSSPAPFPPLPEAVHSLASSHGSTAAYLLPALHRSRLLKDPHEVARIRKANAISSRAHELVMRLLGTYAGQARRETRGGEMPGEWRIQKEGDAEAVFVASCRREDAIHQAYLPIVASSVRAATLHYCCNDKAFSWGPIPRETSHLHSLLGGHAHTNGHAADGEGEGEKYLQAQVLLIDAGCEWDCYASDITRVTPLGNGGRFTPEARAIYSIVLKMQTEAISSLRPGVHWDSVQLQCHVTLVREFLALGLFVGEEKEVLASGVSAAFFPHGVGHSLGLDVHDVPSASKPLRAEVPEKSGENPEFYTYLRLRLPLQAGMVLTVEPGIYFSPHQLAPIRSSPFINHPLLAAYEPVGGVRIEDVLLITEEGCENLTPAKKGVEEVERLASGAAGAGGRGRGGVVGVLEGVAEKVLGGGW
ncbi:Creatinase/aminopeptidase [Calocera viscosa TUFC12733]|uniref:Creatinase/aminopeptidase n=1 Tax=Calocera viscosa (strain TUFC12733) TaxID=1330018 RepID=A0A167J821_CALVF|nr:Creatinase/aminopeptidase [Calocera viscosa TUFC12733]